MLVWVIKHIGHTLTKTFGGTKIFFSFYFYLRQVFHYITIIYIILKITIVCYIYNINSQLLSVKFY